MPRDDHELYITLTDDELVTLRLLAERDAHRPDSVSRCARDFKRETNLIKRLLDATNTQ